MGAVSEFLASVPRRTDGNPPRQIIYQRPGHLAVVCHGAGRVTVAPLCLKHDFDCRDGW